MTEKLTLAQQRALQRVHDQHHIAGPDAGLRLPTLRVLAARGHISLTETGGAWTAEWIATQEEVEQAAAEHLRRRGRRTHPAGRQDNAGRWFPSDSEWQDCCNEVRSPSRAYPWSYMTHCRTAEHVARVYGVDARALKRATRALSGIRLDLLDAVLSTAGMERSVAMSIATPDWTGDADALLVAVHAVAM